jgi:hypothetical protein
VRIERSGDVLLERGTALPAGMGIPCSPEQRFDTASVTEVFTAAAVLSHRPPGTA